MNTEAAREGGSATQVVGNDAPNSTGPAVEQLTKARARYADACSAWRDTILRAHAIRPRLGALELAVLNAVCWFTASWSKLVDTTTTRQIAEIAYGIDAVHGRQRERVRDALNTLARHGLIQITPVGRGRSARLIVSITDQSPLVSVGVEIAAGSRTPPPSARNTPAGRTETPPVTVAHREFREESEGDADRAASQRRRRPQEPDPPRPAFGYDVLCDHNAMHDYEQERDDAAVRDRVTAGIAAMRNGLLATQRLGIGRGNGT